MTSTSLATSNSSSSNIPLSPSETENDYSTNSNDIKNTTTSTMLSSASFQKNDYVSSSSIERSNSFQDEQLNNNNNNGMNHNSSGSALNNSMNNNSSNYYFRNPNSIESVAAPSPAGSLEQFDVTTTPLSLDDTSDTSIVDTLKDTATSNGNKRDENTMINSPSLISKHVDTNSPSFRFRRHSSQSSLNLPISNMNNNNTNNTASLISPLTLASAGAFSGSSNSLNNERVCSSPINSLKMSSRVCQIKIDEGIEPHLSREIKSERETQSTLKLKTSCDELMLNSDELGLEAFSFDNNRNGDLNRNNTNSPTPSSGSSATFRRYRTFSESLNNNTSVIGGTNGSINPNTNMPSPSVSSFYSYSNSSSPTAGIFAPASNTGLLRCFSPSSTLNSNNSNTNNNQNQLAQNYFSQSPSPTRKLFVSRRSMSPIPYSLRPSTLNTNGHSNKRKFSDVDQSDAQLLTTCSPKRLNNDTQEFVQPLLIYTGNNPNLARTLNRSTTPSSQSSSLATTPSSPSQNQFSSLVITTHSNNKTTKTSNTTTPNNPSSLIKNETDQVETIDDKNTNEGMIEDTNGSEKQKETTPSEANSNGSAFVWPKLISKTAQLTNEDRANKYTFVPIQIPPQSSSSNNGQQQQLQHKRLTVLTNNTMPSNSPFSSLAQLNSQNSNNNSNNSPLNSPRYFCDSPLSVNSPSPSVSLVSSSISVDKPDSGYQSSALNNSDSESCT